MTTPSKDALERARKLCYAPYHDTRPGPCSWCSLLARAIDEAVAAEREAVLRMIAECEGDIDFLKFKLRARAEPEAREQLTTAATAAKGEDNK